MEHAVYTQIRKTGSSDRRLSRENEDSSCRSAVTFILFILAFEFLLEPASCGRNNLICRRPRRFSQRLKRQGVFRTAHIIVMAIAAARAVSRIAIEKKIRKRKCNI